MMRAIKNKGFTLIELMVVIVIIGVLASLAIPRFTEASTKAKVAEAPRVLATYESAQLAAIAETGLVQPMEDLVFDTTAALASKWFEYDWTTDGALIAEGGAGIGDLAGVALTTTVPPTGAVTNTITGTDADAVKKMTKYLPNFIK